jgi:hypothetical protein
MKLLSRAICTASLTEIVVWPEDWMAWRPEGEAVESSAPSSLQRKTGSIRHISILFGYWEKATYSSVASS